MKDPIAWEATLPIRPSSPAWCATVKAAYGSALDADELELFHVLSGGLEPPEGGCDELLAVVGRRGGKSEQIARMAVFEAVHGGHEVALALGQVGLIAIISPLREQSSQILNYCIGLARLPDVAPYVEGEPTREAIRFRTGIEIRVMTADAVAVSGPTVVMAIRDEWAKFPGPDAVVPDYEIDNSLRPALAPVVGAPRRRLIGITSAYIQEGLAYTTDCDSYGRADSGLLVVRGDSATFNPALDAAWLAKERKRVGDRVFDREYRGIWQPAIIDSWLGAEAIEKCRSKRGILKPVDGVRYIAGLDLGWRQDGAALAICHRERRDDRSVTVVDGVWFWPAGSADVSTIVSRSARIIREYRAAAFADQHHYDTIKDDYARQRVHLTEGNWSGSGSRSKTVRFNHVRLQMLDGRVEFPDDAELFREAYSLAGRLRQSGTEQIAARTGGDDRIHAVVLGISEILERLPDRQPNYSAAEAEEIRRNNKQLGAIFGWAPYIKLPPTPESGAQHDLAMLLQSTAPDRSVGWCVNAAALLLSPSAEIWAGNMQRPHTNPRRRRELRLALENTNTRAQALSEIRSEFPDL